MDIETERLRLRLLQPDDAEWLAREISNPVVHRWLSTPPFPYGIEDARDFVRTRADNPNYRVICMEEDPLGVVSLTPYETGNLELGYWLKQAAWGQGVMTEASRALIDRHFATSTDDMESGWMIGNAASEGVLRKLGFADNGHRRRRSNFHGAEVDVARVILTKARWQDLREAH